MALPSILCHEELKKLILSHESILWAEAFKKSLLTLLDTVNPFVEKKEEKHFSQSNISTIIRGTHIEEWTVYIYLFHVILIHRVTKEILDSIL